MKRQMEPGDFSDITYHGCPLNFPVIYHNELHIPVIGYESQIWAVPRGSALAFGQYLCQ